MGKMSRLGNELYQGKKSINFVGKPWLLYAISAVLVALAVSVLFLKPLNMGVEFTGGTSMSVPVGAGNASQENADKLREEVGSSGIENADNPTVTWLGRAFASAMNDFMSFLSFVEHHPVGTSVNATVESYSSHGAYVKMEGGVVGYVPLRLMSERLSSKREVTW